MPGHYKKTANKSVRTTVAIYYINVISFLKYLCFRFAKLEDCPIISLHMSITELEVKDQHQ